MKNLALRPGTSAPPAEQRRSQRSAMTTPLEVAWHTRDGTYVCEHAQTQDVSAHGGLLRTKRALPVRQVVALRFASANQWTLARVMRCGPPARDGSTPVGIELAVPHEISWDQVA